MDAKLEAILKQHPGARVVREGDPMPPPPQPKPEEIRHRLVEQAAGLRQMRRDLAPAARLAKATELKSDANSHFAQQKWRTSLVGYVGGIWFLKRGDPPCPEVVASGSAEGLERPEGLDAVVSALGAGAAEGDDA